MINLTDKRTNLSNKDKWILDTSISTEWIDLNNIGINETQFIESIEYSKLSFIDFFSLWEDIKSKLIAFNISKRTNKFSLKETTSFKREDILSEIIKLEADNNKLKIMIKKETQFKNKLTINVKIKENEIKIKELESKL